MLDIFGPIPKPDALNNLKPVESGGIGQVLNLVFKTLIIVGGIYALLNFIIAGYSFLSAGDDPKKAAGAWAKIWQSMVGLLFMAASFTLATIVGKLIFGSDYNILSPVIPSL